MAGTPGGAISSDAYIAPFTMIAGGNPVIEERTPGLIPTSKSGISLKPALLLTPTPAMIPNLPTDLRSTNNGPKAAFVSNVQTKSFAKEMPAGFFAAVVIVAV